MHSPALSAASSPARVPRRSTPGTRLIAAAMAGSSRPLSLISRASLRIGDKRRLRVEALVPAAIWAARYCCTRARGERRAPH